VVRVSVRVGDLVKRDQVVAVIEEAVSEAEAPTKRKAPTKKKDA
jgi:biotin carboxyl carrier protein